jgi:hypothetical protein
MMDDFLGDRKKALEENFFAKHNEELLQKLREKTAAQAKKETLSAASGITEDAVLEELISLNISSETLAALSLVPLVEVAWADGSIDMKERNAILRAAEASGLTKENLSYQLIEGWLRERPARKLISAWKAYVSALSKSLSSEAKITLKQDILGRARSVAEAAGGFLGLGNKISESEKAVLTDLEQAFS